MTDALAALLIVSSVLSGCLLMLIGEMIFRRGK